MNRSECSPSGAIMLVVAKEIEKEGEIWRGRDCLVTPSWSLLSSWNFPLSLSIFLSASSFVSCKSDLHILDMWLEYSRLCFSQAVNISPSISLPCHIISLILSQLEKTQNFGKWESVCVMTMGSVVCLDERFTPSQWFQRALMTASPTHLASTRPFNYSCCL